MIKSSPFRSTIFARRLCRAAFVLALGVGAPLPAAAASDSASDAESADVRIVTSLGNVDVALFEDQAPQTVANFLRLVDDGFYEGLIFHRVIANFVIQAGGYDAEMNYRQPPGTVVNESLNGLRNTRGTLAMARLADPDSADAQFFINVNDNAHLDAAPGAPGYTVFGKVVDGMEVVTAKDGLDAVARMQERLPDVVRRIGHDDIPVGWAVARLAAQTGHTALQGVHRVRSTPCAGMAGVPETPVVIERIDRLP